MLSLWIRSPQLSPENHLSQTALPSNGESSSRNDPYNRDSVARSRGEVGGGRSMDISVASNSQHRNFRADMISYRTHNIQSKDIRMLSEQTAAACTVEDVREKTMSSKQASFERADQENSNLRSVKTIYMCKWNNWLILLWTSSYYASLIINELIICTFEQVRMHFCALTLFTRKPIIHNSSFSPLRLLNNGNSSQITNGLSIIKSIGEQKYIKNVLFKHLNIQIFINSVYWLVHQAIVSILTPFFHLGLPTHFSSKCIHILEKSACINVNRKNGQSNPKSEK